VRTLSGAIVRVVATYPHLGEVLVEWPNGEQARFRVKHLKALPGAES
jgi:hypothetical protein